ncbi:hypothetical protein LTR27_010378 [Elasticomyces elasticus]|nr:hypothetical protein LTR27_010378 [Elasticomyces elasticus]
MANTFFSYEQSVPSSTLRAYYYLKILDIPADCLALGTGFSTHWAPSDIEQSLVKRAPAKALLTFDAAKRRGCGQLKRTTGEKFVAASIFTDPAALKDNGWVAPAAKLDKALPVDVANNYRTLKFSDAPADNPHAEWEQTGTGATKVDYGELTAPVTYVETDGFYINSFNPVAGVLLCQVNYSPDYWVSEDKTGKMIAPPLKQFSDLLWLQWASVAGDHLRNVKFFYRWHVEDRDSKAVLDEIAAMGETLFAFPGTPYGMDTGE